MLRQRPFSHRWLYIASTAVFRESFQNFFTLKLGDGFPCSAYYPFRGQGLCSPLSTEGGKHQILGIFPKSSIRALLLTRHTSQSSRRKYNHSHEPFRDKRPDES